MNPSNGAYISSMTITAPETASAQSASATIVVAFHGANRPNPINVIVNQKTRQDQERHRNRRVGLLVHQPTDLREIHYESHGCRFKRLLKVTLG